MKRALAILFVLLSLLSFVALTFGKLGLMQLSMLAVFVVLAALILVLRNKDIDALLIVFFCLGLLDSLIIFTKTCLSMELVFYALVNTLGLMLPLTGTHVKPKRIRPTKKPKVSEEVKEVRVEKEQGFVASKTGKVYHKASCNWVDNINGDKKVWFKTPAQARKAGYKAHKCK